MFLSHEHHLVSEGDRVVLDVMDNRHNRHLPIPAEAPTISMSPQLYRKIQVCWWVCPEA